MPHSLTTDLLPHQYDGFRKLVALRVGALFMEMGTGKSLTAIAIAMARQDKIDHVVWFCPVSVKTTIRHEILKHTDYNESDIYIFDEKTTEDDLPSVQWYIVGIESMSSSPRIVFSADALITDNSMVIVDESGYIKGHNSLRTNRITLISEIARYRLILNGTPITQGVQDLFSQMKFLSPKILGYRSWYTFARRHLEYSDRYKGMIVRVHHTQEIAEKIEPYAYQVMKEDCLTLPNKLYETRYCSLTLEQREAYERAKEWFAESMLSFEEEWTSSILIFKLFSQLHHIACGFDRVCGEVVSLRHHRTDALSNMLQSIPEHEKVVIWSMYHNGIRDIASVLPEEDIFQYHGKIPERKRSCILDEWRRHGKYLIATPTSGGHGIDLICANYVIFYSNGFKYSDRLQAEDRTHRIGQEKRVTYIDIWADCGIENKISLALANKGDTLDSFRRELRQTKTREQILEKIAEL